MAIAVGDTVRVKKYTDHRNVSWSQEMYGLICTEVTVDKIDPDGTARILFNQGGWWFPLGSLEPIENYIDGVAVSGEEFARRTKKPVYMTEEEVSKLLGYPVKFEVK